MSNYKHKVPGDYTWDHYQRRLSLDTALRKFLNPTPDQIAAAIAQIEENEANLAREREAEAHRLRAQKRDLRNRDLAGF